MQLNSATELLHFWEKREYCMSGISFWNNSVFLSPPLSLRRCRKPNLGDAAKERKKVWVITLTNCLLSEHFDASIFGLDRQSDGKIVAAGDAKVNIDRDYAVARYFSRTTARFDFDGDGKSDVSVFRPKQSGIWIVRAEALPASNSESLLTNSSQPITTETEKQTRLFIETVFGTCSEAIKVPSCPIRSRNRLANPSRLWWWRQDWYCRLSQ